MTSEAKPIDGAPERPPTVLAYLTGTSERVQRATALVVLRMAQLHSQRAGAHEALVEAEADLARALGFTSPVPPGLPPTPESSPAPAMPPKVEALLAAARRVGESQVSALTIEYIREDLGETYRPEITDAIVALLTAAIDAVR